MKLLRTWSCIEIETNASRKQSAMHCTRSHAHKVAVDEDCMVYVECVCVCVCVSEVCGGRRWWENKGDVWRLLQDIAVTVDGRTWPAKDEAQVHFERNIILVLTLFSSGVFSSVGYMR